VIPKLAYIDPHERDAFWVLVAFLKTRLAEQRTIDWALALEQQHRIERMALSELLSRDAQALSEPWAAAWRLIEESWTVPQLDEINGGHAYDIQGRMRAGDRSGALIKAIVDLVAPRLKVKCIDEWRWTVIKRPRRPKRVEHLLSASLTSGELVDLDVLELARLCEVPFLISLASALEAAVNHGLDIARRLGWDGEGRLWQLGDLERTYYVTSSPRRSDAEDPDAFHRGIAPSVKLLHAIVARLSEFDVVAAQPLVERWRNNASPIYLRLWAAMSRSDRLTHGSEVSEFLKSLDRDKFWDVPGFPEVAELRALRFRDMAPESQESVVARIQRGPPREMWPKMIDAGELGDAKLYWSVRELRRIEVAGSILPRGSKTWLDSRLGRYPELIMMTLQEGFPEAARVTDREKRPNSEFDNMVGVERLRALEIALGTGSRGWGDDPADGANDWINQEGRASEVLSDLETTGDGGNDFPKVWNRFGWAHGGRREGGQVAPNSIGAGDAVRVLQLLERLSDSTLLNALEGICTWLSNWGLEVTKSALILPIWLRLWPLAVDVTNRIPEAVDDEDLRTRASDERKERDRLAIDALNTPAGKLVGVFLAVCPDLRPKTLAFLEGSIERQMRNVVIVTDGQSGLIGKHRMIASLPYFFNADQNWTQNHLIAPLLSTDEAALPLWRALARRTHSTNVLKFIGAAMVERANDERLGRETRRRLVFSLVIESLHAFRQTREAAVPNPQVTQMLRTVDGEVRASAADAIQRFVRELSSEASGGVPDDGEELVEPIAAATLLRKVAAPFLIKVWPQERSLTTPGVSRAFAQLPATSGRAFAEAVDMVARFLEHRAIRLNLKSSQISSRVIQGKRR
jgi:hypothetical protein